MKHFLASVIEVVEVALIAIGAVFFIRQFLVQPFLVSGASMLPNFEDGDYLLIDELTYHFREPARGEVVVFRYPQDPSTYFIKRIIALPGETVEMTDNKVKIVSSENPRGVELDEAYLTNGAVTAGILPTTLGEKEYFVMGDNRSYSFDSRRWGALSRDAIIGLVRLRLWPFGEFRAFAAPEY